MKKTFVLFVVIVAALVGYRLHLRSATVENPGIAQLHVKNGRPVRVAKPKIMDLQSTVGLTGQLEPLVKIPAQFNVDGRLMELTKDVGDQVSKGETIARLDSRDQEAALAAAKAAKAMAQAALDKAIAGPRKQELQSARARLAGARAAFNVAKEELQRVKTLVKRRAAAQQQLDQAEGAYEAAQAALSQAQEGLALMEEGTRKEDRQAAAAQLKQADAQLTSASLKLEKHHLKAPVTGIVVSRCAEPGEVIMTMPEPRKIVEIETQDPILFVSQVSELFIPYLSKETETKISVDALPGRFFDAKVHELSPSGDNSSRTFRVEFAIANPEFELKPGMFGRTKLILQEAKEALTIPAYVLRAMDSLEAAENAAPHTLPQKLESTKVGQVSLVMIAKDGLATARAVRTAFTANGRAVVVDGLDRDSDIIIDGFEEIAAGIKVLPTEMR